MFVAQLGSIRLGTVRLPILFTALSNLRPNVIRAIAVMRNIFHLVRRLLVIGDAG
ncbi:hypothetical protein TAL182_PC00480 (plasmid) [Rhizobium sp. TAL182]|nr:hypothetical protein TAL182_PC00480 [Rhizobium sp. TAL182]